MGVEIPAGLTQKQDYEAGGDVEKKKKKTWPLDWDTLRSAPSFATSWPCGLREVPSPLWASVSSAVKCVNSCIYCRGCRRNEMKQ